MPTESVVRSLYRLLGVLGRLSRLSNGEHCESAGILSLSSLYALTVAQSGAIVLLFASLAHLLSLPPAATASNRRKKAVG